jgi:hypothetical protein
MSSSLDREVAMRKRDFDRVARASAQEKLARLERNRIIRELHQHYSIRAIAEAAGLSHGRVGQIIREAQEEKKP